MADPVVLTISPLGGDTFTIDAVPNERIADVKQRIACQMVIERGIVIQLVCGEEVILDSKLVAELPGHDLQVLRSFGASLCEVTIDGEFPADPEDFFPKESIPSWPSTNHCMESRAEDLRQLLNQKTKVQISACHANLVSLGLQPEREKIIVAVMSHVGRLEQARLNRGPKFKQLSMGQLFNNSQPESEWERLIEIGIVDAHVDASDSKGAEDTAAARAMMWKHSGEADVALGQYVIARQLIDLARTDLSISESYVQRHLSSDDLRRRKDLEAKGQESKVDSYTEGLYPFDDFKLLLGDEAEMAWEAAGAAGINEDEKVAMANSQSILLDVEARLRDPALEVYVVRFDLETKDVLADGNSTTSESSEFDLLLRYMGFGMVSTTTSFTLAHHCDIDRSDPERIRVTLHGLAHPANSTYRKGLFGRCKRWWRHRLKRVYGNFDGGWQIVWRFAQNLRELSGGSSRRFDRMQLRWRTVCKSIKSRTLRRCGVPASSNAYGDADMIPCTYKFLFFEGTEAFAAAKRHLLFGLRCRRVGFSRLPGRQASAGDSEPYACDVHFLGNKGVPLAWMWGLNASDSISSGICNSSTEETSLNELRKDICERTEASYCWPELPSLSSSIPQDEWPDLGDFGEHMINDSTRDSDDGESPSDTEHSVSGESDS